MHSDTDPAQLDGYERLLAAILCRAWQDAHGRNVEERAAALAGWNREALAGWNLAAAVLGITGNFCSYTVA